MPAVQDKTLNNNRFRVGRYGPEYAIHCEICGKTFSHKSLAWLREVSKVHRYTCVRTIDE